MAKETTKTKTASPPEKVAQSTPPTKKGGKADAAALPAKPKTGIAARLDQAVKAYPKKQNRSSDLIPLTREFEVMRKKLKDIIVSAKHYPTTLLEVDVARLDVSAMRDLKQKRYKEALADRMLANLLAFSFLDILNS